MTEQSASTKTKNPADDVIVVSSDDDEPASRPEIRAGKRRAELKSLPGEAQRDNLSKRPRLSDSNTSASAPPSLFKGTLPPRPGHKSSASGSNINNSPKRPTVQRTLSSTFKPLPKTGSSAATDRGRESPPNGHRSSSSDDAFPPSESSQVFSSLLKANETTFGKQSKGPPRSVSGTYHPIRPTQASQSQYTGTGFKPKTVRATSNATSISAPIKKSTNKEVIELFNSDDDDALDTIKVKPNPTPASTSKTSTSPSRITGPSSSIRLPFNPSFSGSIKPTPALAQEPPRAKPTPASVPRDPDVIVIDSSEDELLLSPKKVPKDNAASPASSESPLEPPSPAKDVFMEPPSEERAAPRATSLAAQQNKPPSSVLSKATFSPNIPPPSSVILERLATVSSQASSAPQSKEVPSTTRPSHGRKSSSDVHRDLEGLKGGIEAMGLDKSSATESNSDIEIPLTLLPLSTPSSPSRPSGPSTPTKKRPLTAAQSTLSPPRFNQPTSPATTTVRKPKATSSSSATSNAKSGQRPPEDILQPLAALLRLPELVATASSKKDNWTPTSSSASTASSATLSSSTSNIQNNKESSQPPPVSASSRLPSRFSARDTSSNTTTPPSLPSPTSSLRGSFSVESRDKNDDSVALPQTAGKGKRSSLGTQARSSSSESSMGQPAVSAPLPSPRDMSNNALLSRTSTVISGTLDVPTQQETPVAPPVIIPGHTSISIPSNGKISSGTIDISSPLPFPRDASSLLSHSQSEAGPPSSRSPSLGVSSPDMTPLLVPGLPTPTRPVRSSSTREVSSSPPEEPAPSESSRATSSEPRSPKLHPAHRIARKRTARKAGRRNPPVSLRSEPPRNASGEIIAIKKPSLSAQKVKPGKGPVSKPFSPLKQAAQLSDHESDYNAATSSSADEADEDMDESSSEEQSRRTRSLVPSRSTSEDAVSASLVEDIQGSSSSNDEVARNSSSEPSDGRRRRPRRAAAKPVSYYIPPLEAEPLRPRNVERVSAPGPSQEQLRPLDEDEEDEVLIPPKTYGGFQVSSWAAYKSDRSNFKINVQFSRDLPTRLQDQINSWPEYTRQQKDLVTIFKASIAEHTTEDEPNAPLINIINNIDHDPTPPWEFYYTNRMWYGDDVPPPDINKLRGCNCIGRCDPKSLTCACVRKQNRYLPEGLEGFIYDSKGRIKTFEWPIFECNKLCGCDEDCTNRVVQNGRNVILDIQKTENKGWGVFAGPKKIPQGTFIGIYSGEIITSEEAEVRGMHYDKFGRTYLFDLDFWHLRKDKGDDNYNKYTVDAFHAGNFTRFLNHHCEPNCALVAVYVDEPDLYKHLIVLFSSREIKPYEEICFSYYGDSDNEEEKKDEELTELANAANNDAVFLTKCYCGAKNCKKRLWRR